MSEPTVPGRKLKICALDNNLFKSVDSLRFPELYSTSRLRGTRRTIQQSHFEPALSWFPCFVVAFISKICEEHVDPFLTLDLIGVDSFGRCFHGHECTEDRDCAQIRL